MCLFCLQSTTYRSFPIDCALCFWLLVFGLWPLASLSAGLELYCVLLFDPLLCFHVYALCYWLLPYVDQPRREVPQHQ